MNKVVEQGLAEQVFAQNVETLNRILAQEKPLSGSQLIDTAAKPSESQPNTLFSRLKNWLLNTNK